MAKMSKAECSKAGKALSKNGSSAAGKKLAACRWGTKAKAKPAKPKAKAPARQSRRLAGQGPVRQPEPPSKPRKKAKKKAGGQSSAGEPANWSMVKFCSWPDMCIY